jgi:hypothetical protein
VRRGRPTLDGSALPQINGSTTVPPSVEHRRRHVAVIDLNDPELAAEQLACAFRSRNRALAYLREAIGALS